MNRDITYSYSQKPNVDTRFQLITAPTAAKIFLIIGSGARSLILPTNTVITGPTGSGAAVAAAAGEDLATVGGCVDVFGNGNGGGVFVAAAAAAPDAVAAAAEIAPVGGAPSKGVARA